MIHLQYLATQASEMQVENILTDPVLAKIGAKYGKSVAQVILRWLMSIIRSMRHTRIAAQHRDVSSWC